MMFITTDNQNQCIDSSLIFNDPYVSLEAKWLFIHLWQYKESLFSNKEELLNILNISKYLYTRVLKELQTKWYIERTEIRNHWCILQYNIVLHPYGINSL